jgi:hypothetical protein
MPQLKQVTVYSFDELSEEVQDKVVEKFSDFNVDYDWWDHIYQDADRIGIEITEFHTYRNKIEGKLTLTLIDSCNAVLSEHDENCDTYKTATEYLEKYMKAYEAWKENTDEEDVDTELYDFSYEDESNEIEDDYRRAMLEEYLCVLRKEYNYLTSRESIVESIRENEYCFTDEGGLF